MKMNICIFTHKREECFWEVYNPIRKMINDDITLHIFKDGSEFLYSEKFYKQPNLKKVNIEIHQTDECMGISWQKEEARKICNNDHTFFIEDDCIVRDIQTLKKCIEFSNNTGLKHFNWNTYRTPSTGVIEIDGEEFEVSTECEASFQFFHKSVMNEFEYDVRFKNALDHVDVEMQLCKKHIQPPFRVFCSPSFLSEELEQIGAESTIVYADGDLENSHKLWLEKWGLPIMENPRFNFERAIPSLNRLSPKKKSGKVGRPKKPEPVSVVVTIKDRSCFYYRNPNEVLPEEYTRIKQSDQELSLVDDLNRGKGITKSAVYMKDPNGFRPFDNFLISVDKQASKWRGEVELVVVDWSSRDDDVEELIKCFWSHDYKYLNLDYKEQFSRGFALNYGISEAKHDNIHVSDVDIDYYTPDFLEEASKIGDKVSFPVMLKSGFPSGYFMRYEVASFGLATFNKKLHTRVGGYPDYRQWGKEDTDFANDCIEAVGEENYIREPLSTACHQWHSDKHREEPTI